MKRQITRIILTVASIPQFIFAYYTVYWRRFPDDWLSPLQMFLKTYEFYVVIVLITSGVLCLSIAMTMSYLPERDSEKKYDELISEIKRLQTLVALNSEYKIKQNEIDSFFDYGRDI